MVPIKSIFGNAFYYGVIPKIPQLINLLLLPIITPFLCLDDYGIWGIVSSYSSFFLALAPLGLHVHLPNYFFEVKKWKIYWNHIFFLFLVSGMISAILYIGFILVELQYVSFKTRLLIAVFSCCPILLFATNTISGQLYPLLSKPLPLVLRNLTASLCAIAVSFIVIVYFRIGYWGWILGSMTSAIVGFILFSFILYKDEKIYPSIEYNFRRINSWMKISFPVIPHAIGFMLLNSSSRIIMSIHNVSLEDVGIFSNGYMMGDYITIISIALVTALAPQIQRSYREHRLNDYRHIFYLCQLTGLVVVFLVSCWMPDIYKLVIRNESLHVAAPIASYTCYTNILMPFYQFLAMAVFIKKNTKQLLWLVFVPGILNVGLCLIFIPIYGYWAAVFSTLISFWSLLLVPFFSNFHKIEVQAWLGSRTRLFALFIIILALLIGSNILRSTNISIKLIITFIVGGLFLLLLKKKKSLRTF